MAGEWLSLARISEIHQSAVDMGLSAQRAALISGLPSAVQANLPSAGAQSSQLYSDLNWINRCPSGQGEMLYLERWLLSAIGLCYGDPRSKVFENALKELREQLHPSGPSSRRGLSHTSIVLDRLSQWKTLVKLCEESQEHLIFLVHGTSQNAPGAFARRVASYLMDDCTRRHHVNQVQRSGDGSSARTADEWQRCLIRKTRAGSGELGFALERETQKEPVIFVLLDRDEPLRDLDHKAIKELGNFFKGRLNDALSSGGRRFRNPLRFVIPIEHAPKSDEMVKALSEALKKPDKLRLVPLPELQFPPWHEIEEWLVEQYGHSTDLLKRGLNIYERHHQHISELGDELHECLLDWEEDHRDI